MMALLLISHDREFLRRTTDHVLEPSQADHQVQRQHDDYFEQKELLPRALEARAQSQAEKRKGYFRFVNRFGAKPPSKAGAKQT